MKTLLLLVGIGFAFATPFENEFGPRFELKEDVLYSDKYPEVITEIEQIDYENLPIESLINEASHHAGLEFLSDANTAASMGVDVMNIHPDIIADAFSTTVKSILGLIFIKL